MPTTAEPYAKICRHGHIPRREPLLIYIDAVVGRLLVCSFVVAAGANPSPNAAQRPGTCAAWRRYPAEIKTRRAIHQDLVNKPEALLNLHVREQVGCNRERPCSTPCLREAQLSLRVRPGGQRRCVCVCVCVFVRACVRACVCMPACAWIYMYIHVRTYTYTYACMRTYMCMCVCICRRLHMYTLQHVEDDEEMIIVADWPSLPDRMPLTDPESLLLVSTPEYPAAREYP
jgi:hypothetical protein